MDMLSMRKIEEEESELKEIESKAVILKEK